MNSSSVDRLAIDYRVVDDASNQTLGPNVTMVTRLIQRTKADASDAIEYEYEYRDAEYEYEENRITEF